MSEKVCPNCTFINDPHLESCEICGLPLLHVSQTQTSKPKTSIISHDKIKNMISNIWGQPKPEPKKISPIEQNKLDAYETIPESFIRADLLYVPFTIHDVNAVALVDTGAQMTIMSSQFAEKCGLVELIDRKYEGKAKGIGEKKIIGRIWLVDVLVGVHSIPCAFTVLEDFHIDVIFGVDMLRTHNCNIDFHKRCLMIAGCEVSFVHHELSPEPKDEKN